MRTIALIFLSAWAAGCGTDEPAGEPGEPSACDQQEFEGSRFTVCDNEGGPLTLLAAGPEDTPVRSFSDALARVDEDEVAFAMNAGMFDEDGRPIGLTRADGAELHAVNLRDGPGNFHLKPNGVFLVACSGRAGIYESGSVPRTRCAPTLATQSGPMLVIKGRMHPAFEDDGTSRHIRNGVGVTAQGKALFAISQDPVSFGKFARFFRDRLKTPDALYFDGAVSSLWDPANGRMDSHSPLGPIIVALKPRPAQAPARR
ncbi:phosphodiester glycosidase family protein [Sphingomonas sabuli]|uniref:Phosphodiester glycosidase family protein n=1 Tax=Sphingomonas sabuli TaxID=2764186 RepID=A0A7G9L3C5_9SPHN|nr:phosphodiester glycosidase family protein [Sphingomonas sabuli]QNM83124.1 phosphodiester glycosidase family protein [Sphingomonas sabuli]